MTKKIFISILSVASAVLAVSFAIILGVLYGNYAETQENQLAAQAYLIAHSVENEGKAYFDNIDTESLRITWISGDGSVLYDSEVDASSLENHADREEFKEAVETGLGKSYRYSSTLTKKTIYCAQRLNDGTVIRVADVGNTMLSVMLGMLLPLSAVFAAAVILSALFASRLSKRIVKPLNNLNLEEPLKNDTYDELSALLTRIERQRIQISARSEELKHREDEWNTVTGSMNEGIVLLSESNTVLSINNSAAHLLGGDLDCVGKDFLTVCRRTDIQQLFVKTATGCKAEITADFSGAEFQINASPVISNEKVMGTVLLFFDVTAKVHAEQMRREFTANVSHELKTPLQIISGASELMKDGLVKPEDIPAFADRTYDEVQRMITLINDIIELSRLDECQMDLPKESISLLTVAAGSAERLAPDAKKKNIKISISGEDAVIQGVPALIDELVFNLCDNAVKYNKNGGKVDITVVQKDNEATLSIADTGIGIPHQELNRIFERFYRVDKSRSKESGGTGLGLSIVKHIVLLHNAEIDVTSKEGVGTTFIMTFKL